MPRVVYCHPAEINGRLVWQAVVGCTYCLRRHTFAPEPGEQVIECRGRPLAVEVRLAPVRATGAKA